MLPDGALRTVQLERRAFLKLSLGALAGLLVGCRAGSLFQASLDVDGLFDEVHPLADRLVKAATPDEEAYLARVAGLARELAPLPAPDFPLGGDYAAVSLRKAYPVEILQFRMERDAWMPCHDHRDYNGVLVGLEGEILSARYEILGEEAVPRGVFQVKKTREERIVPGIVSTLARRRENLHELRAGSRGARFLDVFTRFKPEAASHFLTLDPESSGVGEGIYEATWA